jgi:hypothetical protein
MNIEGVVMVVHGARAGEPSTDGIPVAFSVREALAHAHDANEAVKILQAQAVLVSHIIFVADPGAHFAVIERAPHTTAFVRETSDSIGVTNHLEGPLALDPSNLRVLATTTSRARRARIDDLLAHLSPGTATPASALAMLRDHRCAGDEGCPAGDRRAIDAFIATHGIVADATSATLWVSVGPKLSGKFVRLDLRALFAPGYDPTSDLEPETLPEDLAFPGSQQNFVRSSVEGRERP